MTTFMRMRALACLFCISSLCAHAEVYKWVDADGKTHFGDKAAEGSQQKAEDISQKLKPVNIDHDSKTRAGSSIAAEGEKNRDELQYEQTRKMQAEINDYKQREHQKHCEKLKKEMDLIASGAPVIFKDENGSPEKVMQRERGEKLKEWQAAYEESGCTGSE